MHVRFGHRVRSPVERRLSGLGQQRIRRLSSFRQIVDRWQRRQLLVQSARRRSRHRQTQFQGNIYIYIYIYRYRYFIHIQFNIYVYIKQEETVKEIHIKWQNKPIKYELSIFFQGYWKSLGVKGVHGSLTKEVIGIKQINAIKIVMQGATV